MKEMKFSRPFVFKEWGLALAPVGSQVGRAGEDQDRWGKSVSAARREVHLPPTSLWKDSVQVCRLHTLQAREQPLLWALVWRAAVEV